MPEPMVIDGCRTPFLRAGTGFRDAMSYQLASSAIGGLLRRTELDPGAVDQVILGATVSNPRTTNVAREAALDAGLPSNVPAFTVTAAGASATTAIDLAADAIRLGRTEAVIAGGTDCISDPPIGYRRGMRKKLFAARRLRGLWPTVRFLASLRPWDFLPDRIDVTEFSTGLTMGEYTEGLARRLGIDREAQDAYAAESHRRAAAARTHLAEEIVGVDLPDLGIAESTDNGVRGDTSVEVLATLKPSFDRDGTLTAGNSSFLTDGASVVLLTSEAFAQRHGLRPKARLRTSVLTAHDPRDELLLGPVHATPRALASMELGLDAIDVFEIHEAFAAQILAVLQLMDEAGQTRIPRERLNAWGGSLALGNPFAPNGARLLTTAVHRLHVEDGHWGLVATCAGGALGQAMVLERV